MADRDFEIHNVRVNEVEGNRVAVLIALIQTGRDIQDVVRRLEIFQRKLADIIRSPESEVGELAIVCGLRWPTIDKSNSSDRLAGNCVKHATADGIGGWYLC